jgi:DNA invertase Pin-like site-specific DNA recombinase
LFFAKGLRKNTDMKIGYTRVSTDEQNLDLQRQALEAAGCEIIYEDKGISGASEARKSLLEALERLGAERIGCLETRPSGALSGASHLSD